MLEAHSVYSCQENSRVLNRWSYLPMHAPLLSWCVRGRQLQHFYLMLHLDCSLTRVPSVKHRLHDREQWDDSLKIYRDD